ncbi:MAG TPA: hypothetical protein VL993_00100 [Stellaceae bacterium]|nr:hypothetical protein [Stellaceae bacterium]
MADDRVDIVFGAEFDELVSGVGEVRDQLQSLSAPAAAIGEQFTLAGTAMENAPRQAGSGWQTAMNGIERDVDGALKGVLLGTETWQEAMKRVFVDLEVSFADMAMKMATSWIESGLGVGGGAVSGGGGILGGGILNMLGGLFAGGAGGGAEDAGADIVGSLAMFQAGAWSIPRDMIAMVHAGEMILPAETAAMARAGAAVPPFAGAAPAGAAGSAGFTLNVSVQAMDAAGVAQWANANARTLASTISKYIASNPSTGGLG